MSTETKSTIASAEHNRAVALRWIDAFNARDDAAEAAARTAGYIAHAPDSIQTAALDSDAWIEFLGVFLEGFPDLHLEVQDSSADEQMVAQRILFTGTHTGPFRGLPLTGRRVRFSGLEINRMVDGKVAALVSAGLGHALRAAGPARRPRPAIAPTAHGLGGHRAVGEKAPHGAVIGPQLGSVPQPAKWPRDWAIGRRRKCRVRTGAAPRRPGQGP